MMYKPVKKCVRNIQSEGFYDNPNPDLFDVIGPFGNICFFKPKDKVWLIRLATCEEPEKSTIFATIYDYKIKVFRRYEGTQKYSNNTVVEEINPIPMELSDLVSKIKNR